MDGRLLFPPKHAKAEEAREALLHVVRRSPESYGEKRSRWTLEGLLRTCEWLRLQTPSGMWRVLHRLGIHYKRGRSYIHSPDPHYHAKLERVQACLRLAKAEPERYAVLFQDEITYYRQPTEAPAYEAVGAHQPLARRSYHKNTQRRITATLDALTGRVLHLQRSRLGVEALVDFYQLVAEAYADRKTIYIVQDNWPVHFHPDVLAALQPQTMNWPLPVPGHWSTDPGPQARRLDLPIQLLPLPTYASWTNPIEKLWRWLRQDVLHLHRYADRWPQLWDAVDDFLSQFADGSEALLRYVGLAGESNLYGPALAGTGPPSPLLPD